MGIWRVILESYSSYFISSTNIEIRARADKKFVLVCKESGLGLYLCLHDSKYNDYSPDTVIPLIVNIPGVVDCALGFPHCPLNKCLSGVT